MTDPKDPHSDEHIEDLLSQLQGIFGKLSQSEEEESQAKVELPPTPTPPPPTPKAAETPPPMPSAPIMEPSPVGAPPIDRLVEPIPTYSPPAETSLPLDANEPSAPIVPMSPAPVQPVPAPPTPEGSAPDIVVPETPVEFPESVEDDGGSVPTVIYYPVGRDAESRTLAQKLETMAPKFTKIAFQLRVTASIPYDLRSDARDTITDQALPPRIRALFFIAERPLDDVRKKAMAAQVEPRGIYFQEVPLLSIEKKAFYTDLLLGLVFFFDSLKSPGSREG